MTGKARFPTWMPGDIRVEWRRYVEANLRCNATYRAQRAGEAAALTRKARKAAQEVHPRQTEGQR